MVKTETSCSNGNKIFSVLHYVFTIYLVMLDKPIFFLQPCNANLSEKCTAGNYIPALQEKLPHVTAPLKGHVTRGNFSCNSQCSFP